VTPEERHEYGFHTNSFASVDSNMSGNTGVARASTSEFGSGFVAVDDAGNSFCAQCAVAGSSTRAWRLPSPSRRTGPFARIGRSALSAD
jgi:hypothetical protein